MKKDRNCGMTGYPMYPNYPGMMPNQGMGPMMMPNQAMNPMMPNQGMGPMMPNQGMGSPVVPNIDIINNNQDDDFSSIQRQINNLDRRVSRLESMMDSGNSFGNKYTDSNYHVL